MSQLPFQDITIHQFRGLQELHLKDLGLINLFVGINNSGKTSVLEALSIYCHPLNIRSWFNTARQREQDLRVRYTSTLDSLQWLFARDIMANHSLSTTGKIEISSSGLFSVERMTAICEQTEGLFSPRTEQLGLFEEQTDLSEDLTDDIYVERKGLDLKIDISLSSYQGSLFEDTDPISESFQFWENEPIYWRVPNSRKEPSVNTEIVTPTSHRSEMGQFRLLSEASFQHFKSDVIDLLQQMDEGISGIDILLSPDSISSSRFQIYIQHKKLGLAPVSTFGDGVRRLLHIALKLASVKGGVLLIDELESTIHTEALQNSFHWLVKWCKEMNVQLFATTHSLEAVDVLLNVTEGESDLVFYRLDAQERKTQVIRHDRERLKILREDLGQEVRW